MIKDHGYMIKVQGSRIKDQRSRFKAQGSMLQDRRPRVDTQRASLMHVATLREQEQMATVGKSEALEITHV